MAAEKCLIIIPTYKEKENVQNIIEAVLQENDLFEVLIVDDNSPDGTATIVENLQKTNNRINLLKREGKLGLGTAYIAGFRYGLENGYDYLFEMDADFSHDPKKLNEMLVECRKPEVDLVIGSRYIPGGAIENWSRYRLFLSYSASVYVRLISNIKVRDLTAGFICYSRQVLEILDLDKIKLRGYGFQIEMKYAAHCNDFNIKEVPITFKDRELGTSKMNSNIIVEAILGVLSMKFKSFSGYYRTR
jgi:dolichol-phosphate mannosyltransferase